MGFGRRDQAGEPYQQEDRLASPVHHGQPPHGDDEEKDDRRHLHERAASAVPIGLNRPREDKTDKACAESDEEAHSSTLQDHG